MNGNVCTLMNTEMIRAEDDLWILDASHLRLLRIFLSPFLQVTLGFGEARGLHSREMSLPMVAMMVTVLALNTGAEAGNKNNNKTPLDIE